MRRAIRSICVIRRIKSELSFIDPKDIDEVVQRIYLFFKK